MRHYLLHIILALILSACSHEKPSEWVSVEFPSEIPEHGQLIPNGEIENLEYILLDSQKMLIVKANVSSRYYQKLNGLFNKNSGPVMHYEFSRVIKCSPENFMIEGKNVWVFEANNLAERKSITFYYLSDKTITSGLTGHELGTLLIVFVK